MTCVGLGLIWGCTYIFLKWTTLLITPLQATFVRVLFGFIPIAFYAVATGVLRFRHLQYIHHFLVMSLLSATVYYFAVASGTALLPTGIAGLLNGAIPLFAFLFSWLFLKGESMRPLKLIGILIGLCGILLTTAPWPTAQELSIKGVCFVLFGACCFGGSFVYARRFISPLRISAVALTTYQMGVALIMLIFITPMEGIDNLASKPAALTGAILGLGFLSTGVAYIAYYRLVESEGAVNASVVTYLPPVVSLVIGGMYGEAMTASTWLAMLAILMGVGIVQLADRMHASTGVVKLKVNEIDAKKSIVRPSMCTQKRIKG